MPIPSDTKDTSHQESALLAMLAGRDPDALAGYYDAHAASVRQYCSEICSPQLVDEAVLSAFTDFLARAGTRLGSPNDLLRKSTRAAASRRMQLPEAREPTCHSVPELLAARANGELPRGEEQINRHLSRCPSCRGAAQRLAQAEDALISPATELPSAYVRSAFLQIAILETPEVDQPPTPSGAPDPRPRTVREHRRRGGLMGAAQRAVSSTRRR